MSIFLSKRGVMGRSDGKSNMGWFALLKGFLVVVWGIDEAARIEVRRSL